MGMWREIQTDLLLGWRRETRLESPKAMCSETTTEPWLEHWMGTVSALA
jgi:hypothetical protein